MSAHKFYSFPCWLVWGCVDATYMPECHVEDPCIQCTYQTRDTLSYRTSDKYIATRSVCVGGHLPDGRNIGHLSVHTRTHARTHTAIWPAPAPAPAALWHNGIFLFDISQRCPPNVRAYYIAILCEMAGHKVHKKRPGWTTHHRGGCAQTLCQPRHANFNRITARSPGVGEVTPNAPRYITTRRVSDRERERAQAFGVHICDDECCDDPRGQCYSPYAPCLI